MKRKKQHNTPIQNSQNYINKARTSEENKETMQKYLDSMIAGETNKTKSNQTIRGNIFALKVLAEWLKQEALTQITKEQLLRFSTDLNGKGNKKSTKDMYLLRIKHFLKWLRGEENHAFNWIRPPKNKRDLTDTELITPTEIKKLIETCTNSRDKLIISALYESACRITEFANLKIKDINIDTYGAKIKVTGKTGRRTIRLIDSVPYLTQWLNEHPNKNNIEADLFITFASNYYGEKIHTTHIGTLLKSSARKANTNKKIYPHLLRHSRISWLAKHENFNERDLRIFAGWSSTSDMPNTYLHYGEEEVDRKLRKIKGINGEEENKKHEEERNALTPKNCPRCKKQNPSDALYCNCGVILDSKEAMKIDEVREKANSFTDKLMREPINEEADLSKGIMEALYQTMKKNPDLLEEFKNIVK